MKFIELGGEAVRTDCVGKMSIHKTYGQRHSLVIKCLNDLSILSEEFANQTLAEEKYKEILSELRECEKAC